MQNESKKVYAVIKETGEIIGERKRINPKDFENESWRERFDTEFGIIDKDSDLKKFIESERNLAKQEEKQRIVGEIEKLKKNTDFPLHKLDSVQLTVVAVANGYNQALLEVIKLLK